MAPLAVVPAHRFNSNSIWVAAAVNQGLLNFSSLTSTSWNTSGAPVQTDDFEFLDDLYDDFQYDDDYQDDDDYQNGDDYQDDDDAISAGETDDGGSVANETSTDAGSSANNGTRKLNTNINTSDAFSSTAYGYGKITGCYWTRM